MGERLGEQPEHVSEREKKAEFTAPSWQVVVVVVVVHKSLNQCHHYQVLNSLEPLGYKVVSCGCYMTGSFFTLMFNW